VSEHIQVVVAVDNQLVAVDNLAEAVDNHRIDLEVAATQDNYFLQEADSRTLGAVPC
jgi:uncharacterized membrane protein YjjP (DUF1212 family)